MKIRLTHLEQLEAYIESYDTFGYYWGNKQQFIKRHNDLKQLVEELQQRLLDSNKREIEL